MDSETQVLVVGAGPTGLVLAAELARHGVIPRVVDAGPEEVKESRAVAVAARSLARSRCWTTWGSRQPRSSAASRCGR
jgi:2-polyprenyl-6-methoxyphenol hydroxylase-like FAD-dependent oxidoreductase